MNKYYIFSEDILEDLSTLDNNCCCFKILDDNSIIIHTEMSIFEIQEYLKNIKPEIPY